MKIKILHSFIITIFINIILCCQSQLLAQDKNVLAQSQYYKAEEAYNEGNYTDAIKYLDKAERYAGNNHLIQYLKVKSLYMNRDYIESRNALAAFFDIIAPSLKNSSQYKEMVLLVSDIEEAMEEYQVLVILRQEEEERTKKDIDDLKNWYSSMIIAVNNNDSTELKKITNETYILQVALLDHVSEEYIKSELNHEIHKYNIALDTANLIFDRRDWKYYKMAKIGNQTWMAENLNYKTLDSYAYDNNENYREALGLLYTWNAAMSACPDGWHLPSSEQWNILLIELGGGRKAGKALKSTSMWYKKGNGTNSSGFNGMSAGYRSSGGTFDSIDKYGFFWSSTEKSEDYAEGRYLRYFNSGVNRFDFDKTRAYSCRCIKD